MKNRKYYSYNEFRDDLKVLIQKIDYNFDTIIAIARGGLSIGQLLGEYYNIRKVYSINTIGYDRDKKLDKIEIFNIPNLKESQNILIVDDIVDSGDTLVLILDRVKELYPDKNFKSASIFYKPSAIIQPDYSIREAKEWIEFFWSKDLNS
ncbi:Xanthine-guanine phosphoribosyltransferase [hydrothermal vent metagenome]|uniref:Xanthine-guanine phosphoribosyltransferase n=1 Tax=hydrothermal vent metagenome TaxID=652676 RepID=A0A1W1EHA9_9ZZZZ